MRKTKQGKDLNNLFYKLRTKNNLSQLDMAETLGVTQSYVSRYEDNYGTISIPVLYKLRSKFKINVNRMIDNGEL